jgi:uncharacterized OB-fold protein
MSPETPLLPFSDLAEDAPVAAERTDGAAVLVGGRCLACGAAWFPFRPVCPSCAAPDAERHSVGAAGTLYSYSTVHISSTHPTPYTLGYVDLDGGVRVLAKIDAESGPLDLDARCRLQVGDHGRWWFALDQP